MKHFLISLFAFCSLVCLGQDNNQSIIYFEIKEDIAPSATRIVTKSFEKAVTEKASLVIIEMDTYGGLLNEADSIRKRIMDAPMPVYVFINKNAASAGALISLACDNIFMTPGSSIGSATVVNQVGEVAPDKYQSYMRSLMRATAESHGADTFINGADTTIKFKRDPSIAEAMVDERIAIPGIVDSGRVAAFTASEATKIGYCDGTFNTLNDLLNHLGIEPDGLVRVEKSNLDRLIGFLSNPAMRGVLIVFIFWGIFFELRSPGIGFPLLVAVVCALIYFAPLYLDGLAANWEILLFIVGIILIGLEVFVIPGFGVAGISGIILTVTSLILSLIRNVDFDFSNTTSSEISQALTIVLIALVGFIVGLILFGKGLADSPLSRKIVLSDTLKEARVGQEISVQRSLIGFTGIAHTSIRPMGKVIIGDEIFECKSMSDFIQEGDRVIVTARELGYWVVEKVKD